MQPENKTPDRVCSTAGAVVILDNFAVAKIYPTPKPKATILKDLAALRDRFATGGAQ